MLQQIVVENCRARPRYKDILLARWRDGTLEDDEVVALYAICLDEFTLENNRHYAIMVEYSSLTMGMEVTFAKKMSKSIQKLIIDNTDTIKHFIHLGKYFYNHNGKNFTIQERENKLDKDYRESVMDNMEDYVEELGYLYKSFLL